MSRAVYASIKRYVQKQLAEAQKVALMHPQDGGRPPPRDAGSDPSLEQLVGSTLPTSSRRRDVPSKLTSKTYGCKQTGVNSYYRGSNEKAISWGSR
jgi:hypothetical protein